MMRSIGVIVLVLVSSVAGCSSGTPSSGDDAGFFRCASDTDCDDGQACTIDSCAVGGMCSFTPVDERCGPGESCIVGRGCTAGTPCDSNADCEDAIACTIDTCGVEGMCRHMPVHERCTDAAAPTCDPVMGCVAGSGCTGDGDCDDSISCTLDTCGADMTCRHMPINARCTAGETCSPTLGCFTPMPCTTAAECQDGNFCNGAEVCMPEFGCAPAETPRMCDDSDSCTVDSCDSTANMCVFACDTSRTECGCPTPGPTCAGTFMLSPGPTQSCGLGSVNYDFSRVTITNDSGVITVTPVVASFAPLSDVVDPVCPMFEATTEVTGDCTERYTLRGTFTDDDHFTGMFEARFTPSGGGIGCFDCGTRTFTVTGTRM